MIHKSAVKTLIVVFLIHFSLNAQTQGDETQATSAEDLAKQLANLLLAYRFKIILTLMWALLKDLDMY